MGEHASLHFPEGPMVATTDPEVQRLRAAVAAKLTGTAPVPVKVGRFVILERVGAGAMGVVYAAYDAELDRKLAIKVLLPSADDRGLRQRLVREAQAMARLSHPNVVGVFEIGEHEGRGFVAMEFVRGQTLRNWLGDAKRSSAEILAAFLQAGRGLAAAHAAGVVHRDFKPDNVLVDAELDAEGKPRVRVVDFGLAHTRAGAESASTHSEGGLSADVLVTRAGVRVGTPGYMAPEQILGEPTDARSDQFAFCVALWEALAGQRPFAGKTAAEVFEHVLQAQVRSPPRGVVAVWIEAVLRIGLAELPADRHPSMDVLLARLQDDPRKRRRRWLALGAAAALVPIGAVGWQARTAMLRSACEDEADVISETWAPEVAAEIRGAFLATAVPNAAAMADRTLPRVEDYVAQWRTAATTVCTARSVERTLDAAAAERAAACLAQQREALATLVVEIGQPDRSAIEGSVASVAMLPAPARCTDAETLALERRTPSEPSTRDGVRELEKQLAAAEAIRRLGHTAEAIERVEALVEPAAALQWGPTIAAIEYRRAALYGLVGELTDSRDAAERSFLAGYRSGDDRTAAASAAMLTNWYATTGGDPKAALHWDEVTESALARIEGDSTSQRLLHAMASGRRNMVSGELEQAELELEHAIALGEQLYGPDHFQLADSLTVLSNVQSRRYAYPESRASAERAYALILDGFGDEHPWTARSLAGLGLAVHYDGDSEEALVLLDRALALDERLNGISHPNVAVDLSYAALVLQESGYPFEAVRRLERALPIYRASYGHDHPEVELVLGNLGRAQRDTGDLAGARASLVAAMAMHERTANTDEDMREMNATTLAEIEELEAERR